MEIISILELVTIKRPIEEYEMVMTIQRVVENMPLTDDQFEIKLREDIKIQNLDEPQPADTNEIKPSNPVAAKPDASSTPK